MNSLMKKTQILILILISMITFLLVYTPHITNPYPIHIDEYHHITEAIKLKQGSITNGFSGTEIGFHIILAFVSLFTDLVLIYKFLPAIWAIISALILFFIIKKQNSNLKSNFFIAVLAMIFFISIRSNVNITGLWFFTPLTFSIPFIFPYIHFFTQGIQQQNKKYLTISLLIMLFLLPIHAISVLFAIPFLIIYSLFHYKYLIKDYKFFSIFLLVPILGLFFYKFIMKIPFKILFKHLFSALQFKKGWGVLELNNSPFELYSLIGYILAIIGIIFIFSYKNNIKKYLANILWPLTLLISIFIFKITNISYLSPYQRNLYYLTISLPILSALGLFYLLEIIKKTIINLNIPKKNLTYKLIKIITIIFVLFFVFNFYFNIPESLRLYKTIDKNDYETLKFLSQFKSSKIMAPIDISTAMFPISNHQPVGTINFYGDKEDIKTFFNSQDCKTKDNLIKKDNIKYIISKYPIECNYTLIYKENNFVYKIQNTT